MFDFIANLDGWAQWLLTIGAAVALIVGFWRWLLPKWRAGKADARAIRDTLVGREPVLDSITGEEIRPAIPGIGSRMADQEAHALRMAQEMGVLTRAVADLASAQSDMSAIQARLDDHDRRITAVEQGHFLERMAGKAESIQLFRTIEQVAKNDPDDPDPAA